MKRSPIISGYSVGIPYLSCYILQHLGETGEWEAPLVLDIFPGVIFATHVTVYAIAMLGNSIKPSVSLARFFYKNLQASVTIRFL
ncbi:MULTISPECIES: hypothetical protein [Cyanophyceae]|uniref:hypothetical protein n=1 Tax=Cyanophyceae TaxID=3028117 RepID=UPI001683E9DB|nr:hypothetical protein [Trichocoleus sp. FACHB-40]MBD2006630.1 hypothetical protein [Trichocoleus sp. FACHB-40]